MKDLEQLVTELADDLSTVKPAPNPYLLTFKLVGAATIYLAVSLAISGVRPDWIQAIGRPWFAAEIVMLLSIIGAGLLSAALLSFPDLYQKRALVLGPLWACILFLVVIVMAWHADSPPAALPQHSIECTICIALLGLLPAGGMFFIMRRFASTHYQWAGGVVMLSAFSIGALWLRLEEPNDSIAHVIEWHYLPMLAIGFLGLWIGKRMLRW